MIKLIFSNILYLNRTTQGRGNNFVHHSFYNKKTTHLIMIIFQEYANNGKWFFFNKIRM